MTLRHPNHRAAMHWLRHGEIACGVAFSRSQVDRRTTTGERKVTCPKCIAVQFAMVGAWRELSLHDDDIVHAVQEALAALPRRGWDATTIKAAYERAKRAARLPEEPKP